MKKYFDKRLMGVFLMIFVFFTAACEAEAAKSLRQKSSVLLVFNNIAGTRYDEKLTQIALEKLQKKIEGIYLEIDAEPYGENFKEKSFEKASFAELTAQVDGCGADYFVYTELQPITKETHFNFIYFDKNVETGLVLRIVDLKNDKELYNKKYLIKGPSGSGKTTFLKILTKQILDYSGHITFNSQDFKNISDRELYSKIGYLPQHGHIFETTLANNLSLFQEKEREDLIKVLQFVELEKWANEEALNKQIDSESVSGGEAKRIELARILLQNKEIIILDEFSSELDKETFKKIENKIFSLPNKTVLYVTHVYDNELINKADQVIQF